MAKLKRKHLRHIWFEKEAPAAHTPAAAAAAVVMGSYLHINPKVQNALPPFVFRALATDLVIFADF